MVVPRKEMRETLSRVLHIMMKQPAPRPRAPAPPPRKNGNGGVAASPG
jgi:acetyl-CoA carboxylase beta subunit